MSEWNTYNISYLDSAGRKKRATMTGLTALDVKTVLKAMVKIDNNQYFDGKILKVWQNKPSSPKQKLAQKYGFLSGCIKGAEDQFRNIRGFLPNGIDSVKANRAIALVEMQFMKLRRDLADVFKLAGLKIK